MGTVGAMGGQIAAYNDWISEVGEIRSSMGRDVAMYIKRKMEDKITLGVSEKVHNDSYY